MQTSLFLLIVEIAGTIAFAISGIRLAAAKNFDWFGAYVVGLVTAIGGGTLRDVLLGTTPFWMQNGWYMGVTGLSLLFVIVFRSAMGEAQQHVFHLRHHRLGAVCGYRYAENADVWLSGVDCDNHGHTDRRFRRSAARHPDKRSAADIPQGCLWHGMHCRRSGVLGRDAVRMQAGDAAGGMCRHCCGDTPACGQI